MSRDTLVTSSKLTALANSIREKADISDSLTLDGMKTAVDNIQTGGDLSLIKTIIERPSDTNLVIPEGVAVISAYAFYNSTNLKSVVIPSTVRKIDNSSFYQSNVETVIIRDGVTSIENYVFYGCKSLNTITLPATLKEIGDNCFTDVTAKAINLPSGLTTIRSQGFYRTKVETINLPASLTDLAATTFQYCSYLKNVTLESGFNCNRLNISYSTLYSTETIVSWLNALADRTGQTAYTLTIGSTNLAKLSAAEIAIATNKNWNLA